MITTDLAKLHLDNTVEAIDNWYNGKDPNSQKNHKATVRSLIKELLIETLRTAKKEVGEYGTNTHSYACIDSFCAELSRNL